jgi:hypothetical protein
MLPRMIAAALVAVLVSHSAAAVQEEDVNFDTIEDLYQVCSVQPRAAEYVAASFACRGFIEGAVQYHDSVSDRKHLKRLICYPKTATVANGRAALVAWAERNLRSARRMDELPVIGLVRALSDKYPCK